VTAKVSAWSTSVATNPTSALAAATITDQDSSGVGITSGGESTAYNNHAIDSSGKDELILINFGSDLVSLTGFSTGWSYNDTDISVLRWTGTTGPDLTTMGLTGTDGLIANGWQLVTSQDLDGSSSNGYATFGAKTATVSNAGSSSWWIISAYFGAPTSTLDADNDYFKLLSFAGNCTGNSASGVCGQSTPRPTPEPGSLALVALALAGLGYARRRAAR
jgi:hypothetical protein